LVLALDEGCVDVDELAVGAEGVHGLWCLWFLFLGFGCFEKVVQCSSPWLIVTTVLLYSWS
jgi:hypothetical protein